MLDFFTIHLMTDPANDLIKAYGSCTSSTNVCFMWVLLYSCSSCAALHRNIER